MTCPVPVRCCALAPLPALESRTMPQLAATTASGPLSVVLSAAASPGLPRPVRQQALHTLPPALQEQVLSLGLHLRQCQQAQGRWFGLGRLGHELHAWVAPRFVTTLAGASVLIALACLF